MFLEKHENLLMEQLRMFFGGKELKNENTVASYRMRDEMVVQVMIRES